MHSVLIAVQESREADDKNAKGKWLSLVKDNIFPQPTTSAIEQLGDYVWLIQLETAMPSFCALVSRAAHWGVPYRVLFFAEPPDWLGTWGTVPELVMH